MGWNRLSEQEQNIAIIAWYEILADAGVPVTAYADCYRAAQARESERRSMGKDRAITTPHDLVAEWSVVKKMHEELDETRLIPSNAVSTCTKCFNVMPHARYCTHEFSVQTEDDELTSDDVSIRAAAQAKQAAKIQEGIKNLGMAKAIDRDLKCSEPECGNTGNTANGYKEGQLCTLGDCYGLMVVAQE